MSVSDLPALNAFLNGTSTVFLSFGYYFIRNKRITAHRNCMVSAFVASTLFLISYLTYHALAGGTLFKDPSWFRPIYLTILSTHIFLAMIIIPLVLVTIRRAATGQIERHQKIARWTWPIWMYVSVTGVLIYFLLYQIFPQHG